MPKSAEPIGMPGCDHRSEGDEQHDDGDREADHLPALDLLGTAHDRARQLGLKARVACDLDGCFGRLTLLGAGRVDAVTDRRVRDPTVGADGRGGRIERIGHGEHVGAGGELGERLGDRRTRGRIGDVTVRVGEHDPTAHAALGREALFEQVDASLSFGARDGEVVAGLATDGGS